MTNEARIRPGGRILHTYDNELNDSDKPYVVPDNKMWELRFVVAQLTATAVVGNRVLEISISDGTNVFFLGFTSGNIAASQVGIAYWFVGCPAYGTGAHRNLTAPGTGTNIAIQGPLPNIILPAGSIIRVWDVTAVDAAADDLIVDLEIIEYDT